MVKLSSQIARRGIVVLFLFSNFAMAYAEGPASPDDSAAVKSKKPSKDTERPRLRICTGTPGNNYHRLGLRLAELLAPTVDVQVKTTRGSWENLEAIDENRRRCDAVVAQEDAYTLHQFERPDSFLTMDRVANLFEEQVHLICNRSVKANFARDLDPKKNEMVVTEFGSGHYVTWKLFSRLNPKYEAFTAGEYTLEEALLRVLDGKRPSCLFLVSKVGGETLIDANAKFGDRLKLINFVDPKLSVPLGRERRKVYSASVIPKESYPRLADKDIRTHAVQAVFFTSPEWRARYPDAARQLNKSLLEMMVTYKP